MRFHTYFLKIHYIHYSIKLRYFQNIKHIFSWSFCKKKKTKWQEFLFFFIKTYARISSIGLSFRPTDSLPARKILKRYANFKSNLHILMLYVHSLLFQGHLFSERWTRSRNLCRQNISMPLMGSAFFDLETISVYSFLYLSKVHYVLYITRAKWQVNVSSL